MKYLKSLYTLLLCCILYSLGSCSDILPQGDVLSDIKTRALSRNSDSLYYYYKGEKVFLPVIASKRYVVMKSSEIASYSESDCSSRVVDLTNSNIATYANNDVLANLFADNNVAAVEYVIGDSIPVAVSNKFYVKLKNEADLPLLEKEADKIKCKVESRIYSDPLWVRLSNDKTSSLTSSIEASNYMYETGLFADVDPGFVLKFEPNYTPTDAYYGIQWGNGSKGIDVEPVWNTNKGKPYITTAIIDFGIYKQHPDLSGVMHPYEYDCGTGSTTVQHTHNHATMIAGIIAANHNSIGVAGVAPGTKLMNICCPYGNNYDTYSEKIANGINKAWQNGADIMNISFGDHDGKYSYIHSSLLESAINNALSKGRNGKGCVITFAAGNEKVIDYPGYVNKDILVVGAIDSDGIIAPFSGKGDALDVMAPGVGIASTCVSNPGKVFKAGDVYFVDDGTSYAAPYAAGLAALILSEDSTLTQKQVCDLIIASGKNDTWNKNYGYGCIDAYKAFQILRGNYFNIKNNRNYANLAYGNTEYYIENYSNSDVKWSSDGNLTFSPIPAHNSILVHPAFTGSSKKVALRANFSYRGYPVNLATEFIFNRDPIIYGIEKLHVYPSDDRLDFKIDCADPEAAITCQGDNVIEFPYAGDADYMFEQSLYFSIVPYSGFRFYPNETYTVNVTAKNQYTGDYKTFKIKCENGNVAVQTYSKGKPIKD